MEFPKKFFEEEVRSGYLVTTQMKKVWACQLEILEKFKQVCDKHGLTFWLESGTLIGAVRHKGYIPWDDDIDVCMMREDYDKLVKIAQEEFTHPLVFQTAYTEKDFIRGHAQIRNVNTSAIIPCEMTHSRNILESFRPIAQARCGLEFLRFFLLYIISAGSNQGSSTAAHH